MPDCISYPHFNAVRDWSSSMGPMENAAGPSRTREAPLDSAKIDAYRPIASSLQKTIATYFPSLPAQPDHVSLPSLLKLDATSYSHRVSGKTLLLNPHDSTEAPSSELVSGKKRNRGDPVAKGKARAEVQQKEQDRAELGLKGVRGVERRLRGGIRRGMSIDYTSLLPLHHLHTMYLIQLFSLRPIPPSMPEGEATGSKTPRLPDGLTGDGITSLLTKADFTGMKLAVLSSRNSSLEGITGIVIEETASTFALVPSDSRVRIIPKDGTLFRFHFPTYALVSMGQTVARKQEETSIRRSAKSGSQADVVDDGVPLDDDTVDGIARHIASCPQIQIDLLGSSFMYRSADRAGRKFRPAQGKGGGSGWGEDWVKGEWSEVFEQLQHDSEDETLRGKNGRKGPADGGRAIDDVEIDVGANGRRKRGKSRRKDPSAGGTLEVHF